MYRKHPLKLCVSKCQPFFRDLDGLKFLIEKVMPPTDPQDTVLRISTLMELERFSPSNRPRRKEEEVCLPTSSGQLSG